MKLAHMLVDKKRLISFFKGGNKKTLLVCILLLSSIGVLGIFHISFAGTFDFIADIVVWTVNILIQLVVLLIRLVLDLLIVVLKWQQFVDMPMVVIGWRITRDIANMFFSAILIVIAIGTILGISRYHYKQNLARLVVMVILVNFSKTICGVIIDFSQIVMLTFSAAVIDAGVGNFLQAVGLLDLQSLDSIKKNPNRWDVAAGTVLALVMALVALVVFIAMTAMLIGRLVTLWILIILSPLAYLAAVLEKTRGEFHGRWWSQFIGTVVMGPILAFFIYLAFATVGEMEAIIKTAYGAGGDVAKGAGQLSVPSTFGVFGVGIAMLIIGMKVAAEAGGQAIGVGALRWGQGVINRAAAEARRRTLRAGVGLGVGVGAHAYRKTVGRGLSALGDTGRAKKFREGFTQAGEFISRIPGLGFLAEAGLRGARKVEEGQKDRARKRLSGMSTNELMQVAKEGGATSSVALEMLAKKDKAAELEKIILENTKDGKVTGRGIQAQKLLQEAYKEAKDRGDDVSFFENRMLAYMDDKTRAGVLDSKDAQNFRQISDKAMAQSSVMDEIVGNKERLDKFNRSFFQVKTVDDPDNAGQKIDAFVDADGQIIEQDGVKLKGSAMSQAKLDTLMSNGVFRGNPAQKAALQEYKNNSISKNLSLPAMKKLSEQDNLLSTLGAEEIEAILQDPDKGDAAKQRKDLVLDAIAKKYTENIAGDDLSTNLGNANVLLQNSVLRSKISGDLNKAIKKRVEQERRTFAKRVQTSERVNAARGILGRVAVEVVPTSVMEEKFLDLQKEAQEAQAKKEATLKSPGKDVIKTFKDRMARANTDAEIEKVISDYNAAVDNDAVLKMDIEGVKAKMKRAGKANQAVRFESLMQGRVNREQKKIKEIDTFYQLIEQARSTDEKERAAAIEGLKNFKRTFTIIDSATGKSENKVVGLTDNSNTTVQDINLDKIANESDYQAKLNEITQRLEREVLNDTQVAPQGQLQSHFARKYVKEVTEAKEKQQKAQQVKKRIDQILTEDKLPKE